MEKLKKWWKGIKEKRKEREYQKQCDQEEKRFKKHCLEADRKHAIDGKRYFVIPAGDLELIVVNNDWLKSYNRMVPKNKRISFKQLIEQSYYCTSSKSPVRKVS